MVRSRKNEIRELLRLSAEEVEQRAGERLVVCRDIEQLHQKMASDISAEIESARLRKRELNLILPVGPTGCYGPLAKWINENDISLERCRFFFMDEYCGEDGNALGEDHPLSFKRQIRMLFLDQLGDGCKLGSDQIIFPDEKNVEELESRIEDAGGIDACFGGIGIHGHLAFNEPGDHVSESSPRKVMINDYTVTLNAVRAEIGGNLECFPRHAFTLGMKQILSARRIRLYCRNGCAMDWANTILRIALFAEPGDDYPVTYIRGREHCIITDRETLASPKWLI